MRKSLPLLIFAVPLAVASTGWAQDKAPAGEHVLLVETAERAALSDGVLKLSGLDDMMVWFDDRPSHDAGHITVKAFVDGWAKGPDSFADDPPNAVLTGVDEQGNSVAITMELTNAAAEGDSLHFDTKILQGDLPNGPLRHASLFIDDICARCLLSF